MTRTASWGELIVGAYHQICNNCEVVSYNNRSAEQGDQMETDVLAFNNQSEREKRHIYVCEVVTHLEGGLYSGSPDDTDGWWMEYSNTDSYHHSLETLWRKFLDGHRYVSQTFPEAEFSFQFWAPAVTGGQNYGYLIQGLDRLAEEFEDDTGEGLELVINEDYSAQIEDLREEAEDDPSNYGSPAFRFIQILENLK